MFAVAFNKRLNWIEAFAVRIVVPREVLMSFNLRVVYSASDLLTEVERMESEFDFLMQAVSMTFLLRSNLALEDVR